MKLFLIERTDGCDYDEHDSAVIRAESEEEIVIKLFTLDDHGKRMLDYRVEHTEYNEKENTDYLTERGYNHYGLTGFKREHTTITELDANGEAGVVISSFNAG